MAPVITSTTSSQAELDHAVSDSWREPFVPPEVPATEAIETETPAATEEEAKTAAVTETVEETEEQGQVKAEQPKKKGGFQKKIDRLTAENSRLNTELEELRKSASGKSAVEEKTPEPTDRPKRESFKSDEDYVDALIGYRMKLREATEVAEAQQAETKQVFDTYNKAVEEARDKYDDFEEVVGQSTPLLQAAVVAVYELGSEGTEVAYYLGKHPEACEKINAMRPAAAAVEIGRIAASLKAPSSPTTKTEKPKPPKPLNTVNSGSARSSVPLDQLSPREYIEVRNRELAARGRR